MTKQTQIYDVAIVGGGMVGMSLAIALAGQGMRVAVIERSAMPAQLEPSFDGRVSAIALGSKRILEGIGAWRGMEPYAEPINDIRVSDGATPVFLHYDHHEVTQQTGGEPFGYIVENRYIRHGLQQRAAQQETLTVYDQSGIESYDARDVVTIQLTNNKTIEARLLIGADGKNSKVRELAGIGATEWGYNQTAIVCTITHSLPHGGLAQERFLPAGPFAVLPMQNNRSSLVWVEPDERVKLYLELPEEEFVQEIGERVGDYLGTIGVADGKRFSYPLTLMHAKDYVAHRIVLAGDAAHGMHPIAGQGVNLGFRDVAVLSELLGEQFKLGLDIGTANVLEHYQRWRRFDNVAMLATTDGLNRLFSTNVLPIKIARDLGMWAVGKMPPLKRFFMRHAMGLVGDLPDLIKRP